MNLVLAGGTGQLGRILVRGLGEQGHQIVMLSRRGSGDGQVVKWDGQTLGAWAREVNDLAARWRLGDLR